MSYEDLYIQDGPPLFEERQNRPHLYSSIFTPCEAFWHLETGIWKLASGICIPLSALCWQLATGDWQLI